MESLSVFFKKLLLDVAKNNASSLHLSVGSAPVMRIYGELMPTFEEAILKEGDLEKIINTFLTESELETLKKEKEILLVKDFGENFRFRVRIFYQKNSLSLSLNYISEEVRNFNELGFPENFKKNLDEATGLLIIAGNSNSGKTSTIASIIENFNQDKKKYIITLEKPIEKIFFNKKSIIEQRQVGVDVNSYSDGLRHALEEDVDLVYVDEIKNDLNLALPLILELASGNCLVILEVNAENSTRALEKIINTSCPNLSRESIYFVLADVLFGVIAQKLIPNKENSFSLALEILTSNFAVKSLIREGNIYQLERIIENSSEEGMISMDKSIKNLVSAGKIDEREINFELGKYQR